MEEYRQYAYDLLMEEQQAIRMTPTRRSPFWRRSWHNAELQDPPEDMTNRYYSRLIDNMTYYASMYGYDLETFLSLTRHLRGRPSRESARTGRHSSSSPCRPSRRRRALR